MKVGREFSKAAGSAVFGRLGGAGGWVIAGAVLVAFGIGIGGLGPAAIAIGGVVVGSIVGGKTGEEVGDSAWDAWGNDIYTAGEGFFDVSATSGLD